MAMSSTMIERINAAAITALQHLPEWRLRCGASTYCNVLVLWDEDYDTRALWLADYLHRKYGAQIAILAEHEGHVDLWWQDTIPLDVGTAVTVDLDQWSVTNYTIPSRALGAEFIHTYPPEAIRVAWVRPRRTKKRGAE